MPEATRRMKPRVKSGTSPSSTAAWVTQLPMNHPPCAGLSHVAFRLWDRIDDPKVVESWHAMNTWVRDNIPMSGEAYRQLINELYKQNRLIEGTLVLRGERVDLKNLTANVLNVIAEADHITPPCQSEGIMPLVGSKDKETFRVRGGHIGIMAGSGAEKTTWPHIETWLSKRAD
jgi:polyhydroxyalkanoate synthase